MTPERKLSELITLLDIEDRRIHNDGVLMAGLCTVIDHMVITDLLTTKEACRLHNGIITPNLHRHTWLMQHLYFAGNMKSLYYTEAWADYRHAWLCELAVRFEACGK